MPSIRGKGHKNTGINPSMSIKSLLKKRRDFDTHECGGKTEKKSSIYYDERLCIPNSGGEEWNRTTDT